MSGFDLRDSPFYALALSPRANRAAIAESFEAALEGAELDETTATKAQQTLMAAKPRLLAELSWLLGLAPNRARHLVDVTSAPSLADLSSLPALAGVNLAAHWCSVGAPDLETIGFTRNRPLRSPRASRWLRGWCRALRAATPSRAPPHLVRAEDGVVRHRR